MKYAALSLLLLGVMGAVVYATPQDSRVYETAGGVLVDGSLLTSEGIRSNRYYEVVAVSTPTAPPVNRIRLFLSTTTANQLCQEDSNGLVSCLSPTAGTITSVTAGRGLIGGGTAGGVTLYLSTPVVGADIADGSTNYVQTNPSAQQTGKMNVSSGTITNFTALASTSTSITSTNGIITFISGSTATITHLVGTTTNNDATVGTYGEYLTNNAQQINCLNTGTNVTSLTLSAGDWDIAAVLALNSGGTPSFWEMHVNTSSASVAGDTDAVGYVYGTGANSVGSSTIPMFRASVASATTYYLNVRSAGSNQKFDGALFARRVR